MTPKLRLTQKEDNQRHLVTMLESAVAERERLKSALKHIKSICTDQFEGEIEAMSDLTKERTIRWVKDTCEAALAERVYGRGLR